MGVKNTSLSFDQNLADAAKVALNTWNTGYPHPTCTEGKEECNLENEVRSYLEGIGAQLHRNGGYKKCCGRQLQRKNSDRFNYSYENWNPVSGWGPALCPQSCTSFSNDIYYSDNNKTIIVEIKIISHKSNCMSYLMKGQTQDHIVPKYHHFNLPSQITVDKPVAFLSKTQKIMYYSYFAEGQLWLDILRMIQAKNHFSKLKNNCELYLLLFTVSPLPITSGNHYTIENTLNIFDTRNDWLYHDYNGVICRSKTVDYEYEYKPITPTINGGRQAFLVRIEPK